MTILDVMKLIRDKGFYEPCGFCNQNAQTLVEFLNVPTIKLSEARVLYIIPSRGEDPMLIPRKTYPREDVDEVIWDFYVVLLYQNRIYDFDFTGHALSPKDYLKEMFDVTKKNDDGVVIRSIPAREYLNDHVDHTYAAFLRSNGEPPEAARDYNWYVHDSNLFYPAKPAKRFIEEQE